MFDIHCPRHDARVLIWPSGVDAVVNRDGAIEVHFHCTCGYRGVWRTGRTSSASARREAVRA